MDEVTLSLKSESAEETAEIGYNIGQLVDPGQLILLSGDLGAGKTVFTQGLCSGLGVEEDITSPTFNLINEYEGDLTVYHMDLYRLENEDELYNLGFEDYLERNGVMIIEWPDLAYNLIPPEFIYIKFIIPSEMERILKIEAEGEKSSNLVERIEKNVGNGN
ncbi:MAG: tRNA (adenosine(37)-N6)-threonylcarbamoyltransferase complex ATPase subunit type 1 TsaE [Halanaerobiaceae bacterium]